jgi:hypothetical protein
MRRLIAHRFVLRARDSQRPVARALVCPEVQYACVRWEATERLERLACKPNLWHSLTQELEAGFEPGPLPVVSAPSIMLAAGRLSVVVTEYDGVEEIEVALLNPTHALDRRLDGRNNSEIRSSADFS